MGIFTKFTRGQAKQNGALRFLQSNYPNRGGTDRLIAVLPRLAKAYISSQSRQHMR